MLKEALIASKLAGGGGGGGSSSVMAMHYNESSGVCDKTFQEVFDAVQSGAVVTMVTENSFGDAIAIKYLRWISYEDGYIATFFDDDGPWTLYADSADGYLYAD